MADVLRHRPIGRFLSLYFLLALLFLPFSWKGLGWWTQVIHAIWDAPTAWVANWFTAVESPLGLSSDSPQLIAWLFLLLIPTWIIGLLIPKQQLDRLPWISILSYFLALIFLRYGLDKLSGGQFPAPDLFVLDTTVGELDSDILYWTTVGSSRSYQWFLGMAEIIPAILLLWSKTRLFGLLLLLPITINIAAVNWCFDISVKVLSGLLLATNGWITFLNFRRWKDRENPQQNWWSLQPEVTQKLRWLILLLISWECVYPYVERGYFYESDATVARYHGIYQPLDSKSRWSRLIVLRDDYWLIDQVGGKRFRWYRADLPYSIELKGDTLLLAGEPLIKKE
ncbi:MAG: hypothetical protein AAF741_18090 [Bacteroidota bacterium]